jgi:hypothetical protein
MFCSTCGSEISADLKYCNRCGANLAAVPTTYPVVQPPKPIRLTLPAIVMGLTIVIGIGITMEGARDLASLHAHPAAIAWIVIVSMAALFGCNALILRFWMKVVSLNRESYQQHYEQPVLARPVAQPIQAPQYTPRLQPQGSVTEHTTRTFSPIYREGPDRENR